MPGGDFVLNTSPQRDNRRPQQSRGLYVSWKTGAHRGVVPDLSGENPERSQPGRSFWRCWGWGLQVFPQPQELESLFNRGSDYRLHQTLRTAGQTGCWSQRGLLLHPLPGSAGHSAHAPSTEASSDFSEAPEETCPGAGPPRCVQPGSTQKMNLSTDAGLGRGLGAEVSFWGFPSPPSSKTWS